MLLTFPHLRPVLTFRWFRYLAGTIDLSRRNWGLRLSSSLRWDVFYRARQMIAKDITVVERRMGFCHGPPDRLDLRPEKATATPASLAQHMRCGVTGFI